GKKRLNITDVAIGANLSRATVSGLYHDDWKQIQRETIEKLCAYLECMLEDLFELTPEGVTIEMVSSSDPDYDLYQARKAEPSIPLEECHEVIEKLQRLKAKAS
ncbi:MAG: helix-turn-helix transcriptional regulator, partial [Candidatus Tectomicrobia bacterium]|nr:helix-turn-helix transcriptional regulator [Candidatus Tectomicrobia bacterium]